MVVRRKRLKIFLKNQLLLKLAKTRKLKEKKRIEMMAKLRKSLLERLLQRKYQRKKRKRNQDFLVIWIPKKLKMVYQPF